MIKINKKILPVLFVGLMGHASVNAMEEFSSSSSEDFNYPGFIRETMLDPRHPSGLNLQEIVNDQHQRRLDGEGVGFSTDVVGIANSRESLSKLMDDLGELNEQIRVLNDSLGSVKKAKVMISILEDIDVIQIERDNLKGRIDILEDIFKNLKRKVSDTYGIPYNALAYVPRLRDLPSQNIIVVDDRIARNPVIKRTKSQKFLKTLSKGNLFKSRKSTKKEKEENNNNAR